MGGAAGFADIRGTAFDGTNRPTTVYSLVTANGTANTLSTETLHYDTNGYAPSGGGLTATYHGQLTHACNANNQCEYFAYDSRDLIINVHDTGNANLASRTVVYDLDGRATATQTGDAYTGASAAYTYTYTPDSLLATEQEPTSLTSAAKFTHNYFSDGREKSLDLVSGVLSQAGLFQYSYDGAGSIDSYSANFTNVASVLHPGTASATYGYNSSELLNSMSVTTPGTSKTFTTSKTYSDGLVSSITYPAPSPTASPASNVIRNMQYNAEGELLGYSGVASAQYTYSTRGELERGNTFANGLELPGSMQSKWDPVMGAPIKEGTGTCPTMSFAISCWTYDGVGRMTQETIPAGFYMQSTITLTRTYDAENRLISTSSANAYPYQILLSSPSPSPGPLNNIQSWGPNGRPQLLGGNNPTYPNGGIVKQDTLHWSSDGLIYTSKPSGTVDDLKLGTLGDVMPLDPNSNGATFYERGPEGIGGCYNAGGAEIYSNSAPFGTSTFGFFGTSQVIEPAPTCQMNQLSAMPTNIVGSAFIGSFANYPTIGNKNGVIGMPRTDGLATGTDIIQGVRAYDPNSGTWTSPDTFGGVIGDPISQKSYVWNNNNPLRYSDFNGHCPYIGSTPGGPPNVSYTGGDCSDTQEAPIDIPVSVAIPCYSPIEACFRAMSPTRQQICAIAKRLGYPAAISLTFSGTSTYGVGGHVQYTLQSNGNVYIGVGLQAGSPGGSVAGLVHGAVPWSGGVATQEQTQGIIQNWSLGLSGIITPFAAGVSGNDSGFLPGFGLGLGSGASFDGTWTFPPIAAPGLAFDKDICR